MTLLEVLAALAILATLLAGLLMAKGRFARQQASAQRRLQAIAAADDLLGEWWVGGAMPLDGAGEVSGQASMRWQTRSTEQTSGPLPSAIVRLEVKDARSDEVLAHADLWVALTESQEADSGGSRFRGQKKE